LTCRFLLSSDLYNKKRRQKRLFKRLAAALFDMSIILHDNIISYLHLLVIGADLANLFAILLDIDLAILFSPAFFAIFIHYFYIFHFIEYFILYNIS